MRIYSLRIYKFIQPKHEHDLNHELLGSYENLTAPPWVPRQGEFFRFKDPSPPNGFGGLMPTNHQETAGRVTDVVTMHYGASTTIEVYILPRGTDDSVRRTS